MTMDRPLGSFLRSCRLSGTADTVSPHSARSLTAKAVAGRAGISVSYYRKLESGRRSSPSPTVVRALADALGLSGPWRDQLHALAGLLPDVESRPGRDAHGRVPALHRLAESLDGVPVMVATSDLDVVTTNHTWRLLYAQLPPASNWACQLLLESSAPSFYADWALVAKATVHHLRYRAENGPTQLRAQAVLRCLQGGTARSLGWQGPVVADGGVRRLRVRHATLGLLDFTHDVLLDAGAAEQRAHVLFPRDAQTAVLLQLLRDVPGAASQD
jgi:transcriptional regulator with XRE-family HTH domain